MLNDKGVMTKTITVEQRLLTGIFPTMLSIHYVFTRHQLEFIARSVGLYNKEVVRELYVYYIETLRAPLDRKCYPAKQAPVHYVRVRGRRVEIFLPTICCFLYCADIDATRAPLTPDFDYQ